MKIKHLLLVALTALVLGLASIGVVAPAIAGGRGGLGGEVHALASGNAEGGHGGNVYSVAGSSAGAGGDISR